MEMVVPAAPGALKPRLERSWSWGESNPRPPGGHRTRYDRSRIPALAATGLAGQWISEEITAGSFPDVSVLSRRQWSFPTVHPRFCCRAAWIWPRAPLLVTVLLFYLLKKIRRRERTAHFWRFIWCPRLTSLRQLGSQIRLPGPNVETSQPHVQTSSVPRVVRPRSSSSRVRVVRRRSPDQRVRDAQELVGRDRSPIPGEQREPVHPSGLPDQRVVDASTVHPGGPERVQQL